MTHENFRHGINSAVNVSFQLTQGKKRLILIASSQCFLTWILAEKKTDKYKNSFLPGDSSFGNEMAYI